jgi:cold shock CspA family protein
MDLVAEPENRKAYVTFPSQTSVVYKKTYRAGVSSIIMADDNIAPAYHGLIVRSGMNDVFVKMSQIFEAGFISYLRTNAVLEDFKTKPDEIGPQVLTVRHLSTGFSIIC